MTRRIEATGDSLQEAVAELVAEVAECDVSEVAVSIEAPNLTRLEEFELRLELRDTAQSPAPAVGRDSTEPAERSSDPEEEVDLDAEADAAADFLEGLLDALELPGDLKIRIQDDYAEVEIVEVGSGALIGRRGQTLEAIQELVRCSLQREFQRRAHVKIDVEGYRSRRLEKLLEKAADAVEDVRDSGESERLEPMDVFERKAIHRLVAEHDGVTSRSQGREPSRRVIIEPA